MAEQHNLFKRISLEFLNQFPGQVYLRLEPYGIAATIMIQVLPADIVAISQLAEPYTSGPRKGERITEVETSNLESGRNPHTESFDDDFQPGDSG